MKTRYPIVIILSVTFLLSVLFLPSCATNPNGGTVIKTNTAVNLASVLRVAASGAVVYAYTKDTNSIVYITASQAILHGLIQTGDLDAASIQSALTKLGVKELNTPEAQLLINTILQTYTAFGQQYVQLGFDKNEGLKILMRDGLLAGIDAGLKAVKGQ